MTAVDVLAVMVKMCTHGGMFEPKRIIPEWNGPTATSIIASRMRPLKTAAVRRALERAEKAGDVIRCGTGKEVCDRLYMSAADKKELYWRISDAALARCQGGGK